MDCQRNLDGSGISLGTSEFYPRMILNLKLVTISFNFK